MSIAEHADALTDAYVAVEAATITAARAWLSARRSKRAAQRLALAVRALEAVDALREEAWS